jgi:hypothetical protein
MLGFVEIAALISNVMLANDTKYLVIIYKFSHQFVFQK